MLGSIIASTATLLGKVSNKTVKELSDPIQKIDKLATFLHKYGYLTDGKVSLDEIVHAIRIVKTTYALPVTDEVDGKLLTAIELPRCGCVDIQRLQADTLEAKWRKTNLTYGIASYLDEFSAQESREIIDLAWKSWSQHTNITLTYVSNWQNADIIISTGRGPRDNFDGPSKTLAWAYLPNGSDSQLLMKFDIDELWTKDKTTRGIVMFNVAAHEFGHLLGLEHSRVSTALMAPYYNPNIAVPQSNDDISRIQLLYGIKTPSNPPTIPTDPELATITIKSKISDIVISGYKISKI